MENSIVNRIERWLPIYTLANDRDMATGCARRIQCAPVQWQDRFREFAKSAALIVVVLEDISEGVAYELRWIVEQKLKNWQQGAMAIVLKYFGYWDFR